MQSRILLQFHVTGRCNLRCKHCYRTEGDAEPLSTEDIFGIIEQYKSLLKKYNERNNIQKRGHINFTGGEPFIRDDIKDIIKYAGSNREYFSFGMLSNGSFIDDEMIALLKENDVAHIQLSIDGDRDIHDNIRAEGDYDRVMKTAEMLESNGIRTMISFTAGRNNHKSLPKVAAECRKRGISKLWTDRLVPIGNGAELEEIRKEDMPEYIRSIRMAKGNFIQKAFYRKTEISANRALQFLAGGNYYSCSAGDLLITVDEFGNILPCRRMPIICGNIFETDLVTVYFESKIFRELRSKSIPKECEGCRYSLLCRGGAKCQSYAKYGSFHHADPACSFCK